MHCTHFSSVTCLYADWRERADMKQNFENNSFLAVKLLGDADVDKETITSTGESNDEF